VASGAVIGVPSRQLSCWARSTAASLVRRGARHGLQSASTPIIVWRIAASSVGLSLVAAAPPHLLVAQPDDRRRRPTAVLHQVQDGRVGTSGAAPPEDLEQFGRGMRDEAREPLHPLHIVFGDRAPAAAR
jgi:hypothetical protein